jgi:phosphatidylethanolamine N-methyltransferase
MSGAAFFGMALISGSMVVFALAVFSHLSHWWFLSNVEEYVSREVSSYAQSYLSSSFVALI